MKTRSSAGSLLVVLTVKLALATGVAFAAASLAGCNTVQGVGRDITAVGEGGQDLIDDATGSRSTTSSNRR